MLSEQFVSTVREVSRFVASRPDAWALPEEAARFLHCLILATGARRGLEIGTSYGYSGLWLAAALKANGGKLVTIDKNPAKSRIAREHFERAGLADAVELHTGEAAEVMRALEGPFDFVLNDADKHRSRLYFDLLEPKMPPRALFVSDNAFSHPASFEGFLDYIRRHERFFSVTAPIGNGLEISVKIA